MTRKDLQAIHRSYPARHVPFATVSRVHADVVLLTGPYSVLYRPHDTTTVRLYMITRIFIYMYIYIRIISVMLQLDGTNKYFVAQHYLQRVIFSSVQSELIKRG